MSIFGFASSMALPVVLFFLLLITPIFCSLPPARPPPSQRKFNSSAINEYIATLSSKLANPEVATLFSNCFPNTLDTTVEYTHFNPSANQFDTFVITGDIDAMWQRDSMNQIQPYLPFMSQDPNLQYMVCGLLRRQSMYLTHDPYANAFNFNFSGAGNHGDHRKPPMSKLIYEGKYELDSIVAVLKLSRQYYTYSEGDVGCFDVTNTSSVWISALEKVMVTIEQQQTPTNSAEGQVYQFERETTSATETLELSGRGVVVPGNIGLIRTQFRPSDDATTFPYNIAENAFAATELINTANVIQKVLSTPGMKGKIPSINFQRLTVLMNSLTAAANAVEEGIQIYGIVSVPKFISMPTPSNMMFAYEVDGYGGQYISDDSNIPSLLSLPYLGYLNRNDSIYQTTKSVLMNTATNPFFFAGAVAQGQGSVHTGLNSIWPMALIMQAWGSDNDGEIAYCLDTLVKSSAGTGFLHESFTADDFSDFTRSWFSWVNSLFGELIVDLVQRKPHLVLKEEEWMKK